MENVVSDKENDVNIEFLHNKLADLQKEHLLALGKIKELELRLARVERYGIKEKPPKKSLRRLLIKLYLKDILKHPYFYLKKLPRLYNYWQQYGVGSLPINLASNTTTKIPPVKSDILKFIITGLPHSGTTALSEVFRQVPGLFSGFECGFLLHEKPLDFVNPKAKYKVLYEMLKTSWGLTDIDVNYICNSTSWEKVYLKLRERSSKINNKQVSLFDKTPYYMLHLEEVLKKVDNVKIIVILKDVRALYYSYKRRGTLKAGLNHLNSLTNEFADVLLNLAKEGRIFLLHYENMCLKPELELKKVFDFLGLDFKRNYLTFIPKYANVYGKGLEDTHILTYKNHLTDKDYHNIASLVKHPLFYGPLIGLTPPSSDGKPLQSL